MAGATERVSHVAESLPEICTLDCGTMNFSLGDYVMTNTPSMLRAMAKKMTALGVRPRDRRPSTRPSLVRQAAGRGRLHRRSGADPALHGHSVGRARRPQHLHGHGQQCACELDLLGLLDRPQRAGLSGCRGAGRRNVRVGLEDNLYLSKGVLATNAQLVDKARSVIEGMGARIIGPAEVREKLKLTKR